MKTEYPPYTITDKMLNLAQALKTNYLFFKVN